MLKVVPTHDPEVMRLDDDSLLRRAFGVGFIALLVVVPACLTYVDDRTGERAPPWQLAVGAVIWCVGVLIGVAICTYSSRTLIDRRLGRVVHWSRVLWWQLRHVEPLDGFVEVRVVRATGRPVSWGAALTRAADEPNRRSILGIGLARPDAERLASQVAVFVGLPLHEDVRGRESEAVV